MYQSIGRLYFNVFVWLFAENGFAACTGELSGSVEMDEAEPNFADKGGRQSDLGELFLEFRHDGVQPGEFTFGWVFFRP